MKHLHERIGYRLEELRQADVSPEKYLVPGARKLVLALRARGLALHLASGTDENMKEVSGVAAGLAAAEPDCQVVDEWKRQRLAGVGAHFIVPNFLCHEELMQVLFADG